MYKLLPFLFEFHSFGSNYFFHTKVFLSRFKFLFLTIISSPEIPILQIQTYVWHVAYEETFSKEVGTQPTDNIRAL
jgi:hypothetical protein